MTEQSNQSVIARVSTALLAAWLAAAGWPVQGEPISSGKQSDVREPQSLWEFGLFNGAARIPEYPGSDEYRSYLVPIPYFIYRGRVVRSGRDGLKGIFYQTDRFQTDVSMSGNPPGSRNNAAREGMPEQGAMAEIGPAIKYHFLNRRGPDNLYAQASVRSAFSFDVYDDLRSEGEGYRACLELTYNNRSLFADHQLRFGANLSVDYVTSAYSDYYYGVAPEYATDTRPAYDAKDGYGGLGLSGYASKRLNRRVSVGIFAKWINLDQAVFEDSPLVKTHNNVVLGCALVWRIAKSEELARSADDTGL